MTQQTLGGRIAALRKEKGWTQTQLGEHLGVTNKTISRWENGNYIPDLSLLQPLCQALEITLNELLSGRRLEEESYKAQAEENLLLTLQQAKKLECRRGWISALEGGGTGLLISAAFSSPSPLRLGVIAVGALFVLLGWALHAQYDKSLLSRCAKGKEA